MDKRIILISCMAVSILITGCIQSQEEEPSGPEACSQVYKPVCGKNGQTYSNDCVARQKGVEVDYPGECRKEPETTIREKCGDGVCDETERKRNLCPEDCEKPPPSEEQTCSEQEGVICSSDETCTGSWLDASDIERCCSGECETLSGEISLHLLKTIEIPNSARPEIVANEDKVFVVYRDNENVAYEVKIYSKDMETELTSKTLVTKSADYGMPTDMRIASDGEYLYAFYEMITDKKSYLFGSKYRLDDDFEKVKSTDVISSDKHPMFSTDWINYVFL